MNSMVMMNSMAVSAHNAMNAMPNQLQYPTTPMVSLGRLIDFSIQRTYHELTVLADLLPRKTDMERKMEIVTFASRTRQLFVRLLALVKWAGSASKVEKCASIVSFLDKQAVLLIETADILAKMSREALVLARLPSFQLPSAVEVLTLGTYSRLPTCIRDRIVPSDPITASDKKATLLRLNQIIQQRLVSSCLPSQMRSLKIEYGRVTFHVDHEFELSLTLMGDSPTIPWRVLNIDILVEDKETGGGKDLVHPLQIMFVQHLIQSRLTDNNRPLIDAYNCLHSFCLSLQLEVLHAQAIRLCNERLDNFIRIDEYLPGNRLILSYWKEHPRDDKIGYKLFIEIDTSEPSRPLQVTHYPELGAIEAFQTYQAIKSDHLSIEKVLIRTTYERAKQKLIQLKREFQEKNVGESALSGSPAVLHVSFLQPCMTSERLLISIDTLTGHFLAHIPQFDDCPLVDEIQAVINKNTSKAIPLFRQLRTWLTRERCKKTVQSLPVHVTDCLPFPSLYNHQFLSIKSPKLFFQFSKHHQNCLVAVFEESQDTQSSININYYLLYVSPTSLPNADAPHFEMELPKPYMQLTKVLRLDVSNILHPYTTDEIAERNGKRKISNQTESSSKIQRTTGYFIPELAHVVSFCEEKLSYSSLSNELQKRSIYHQVLQDSDGYTHMIDIVKFPNCHWCPQLLTTSLQNDTLSSTIRLQGKGSKIWNVIIAFCNPPIQTLSSKEHGSRRLFISAYDYANGSQSQITKMVDELLLDWTAIARLYDVVKNFATAIQSNQINLSLFDIKSYSYKKLVLGYGPNKTYSVAIYWKSTEKRFHLSFGVVGQALSDSNPHVFISTQLQHEFNQHLSIIQLLQVLSYTLNPLLTLQGLSDIPLLGVINSRPAVPVQAFCILPQSSTHIRLIYRNIYCLDIVTYPDNLIAIRDGAFSLFDKMKVVEDLTPIQGLKAFLNKFVDKTTQMRRLSQTEDDNPPSPMPQIESVESYLFATSQMKTSSPSKGCLSDSSSNTGGRVLSHQMASSAQGSNPHTPTSPHTSILSQSGFSSSPGTFPLSSPPSHGMAVHSVANSSQISASPSMPVRDQSPGNLFGVNSPINPLHAPSPSFMPSPTPSASAQFHSHSPASQYLQTNASQTGHESGIGSPFAAPNMPASNLSMPSPAQNVWPSSPSVQRASQSPRATVPNQSPANSQPHLISNISSPQMGNNMQLFTGNLNLIHNTVSARLLPPQRSWAASIPTLLTHQGFDLMCRQNSPPIDNIQQNTFANNVYYAYSQLERFLGCVFMRRNLQRSIQQDESFTIMHTNEPGIIHFKNETMQFKIGLDTNTMQTLHLKIFTMPEFSHWSRDELDTLTQFFENKVACAPYKPNAFLAYIRILNTPIRILKDCIQLMRLEMIPDRTLKWSLQWCLTFPPSAPPIASAGMSACLMVKNKMLIFMQLTRMTGHTMGLEPHYIIVPFLYDVPTNSIQVFVDRRDSNYMNPNSPNFIINNMLKRFAEYHPGGDCIIFAAIREVMANFQMA